MQTQSYLFDVEGDIDDDDDDFDDDFMMIMTMTMTMTMTIMMIKPVELINSLCKLNLLSFSHQRTKFRPVGGLIIINLITLTNSDHSDQFWNDDDDDDDTHLSSMPM